MSPRLPTFLALGLLLGAPLLSPARAKSSEWKDHQGASFRGEPVEVLGPFALFRTANNGSRRVLLRGLTPDDAVRFATEAAAFPPRAPSLALARSRLAADLAGATLVVANGALVPATLEGRPEPEVFVALYGSRNDPESWTMIHNFAPTYRRLRAAYPDTFETVLLGLRENAEDHRRFAVDGGMPWLVADLDSQRDMAFLGRFAPAEGILMLALSRGGAPLLSSRARSLMEVKQFVDDLTGLLRVLDAENPAGWADRLQYFNTVRPALHTTGTADPLLIGCPLRADVLRQKGVATVAARIDVGADGRPTAAALLPEYRGPEDLRAALADALRRGAVFSPALDQGRAVAGVHEFRLEIAPTPGASADEVAWLRGEAKHEIPLPTWLVLRPILVPEQSFSSVERIDADGMNVLSAFEVSDEKVGPTQQRNYFNTDWFAAEGAASVSPKVGDSVTIGGRDLAWQAVAAKEGFVELRLPFAQPDYCIGYAWIEFDVPQDTPAWLGIGSDDGLKIWHNGTLVHTSWVRRISAVDDDIVALRLKAGKNRLLLKIQNATGDWNFVARLRTR